LRFTPLGTYPAGMRTGVGAGTASVLDRGVVMVRLLGRLLAFVGMAEHSSPKLRERKAA
jgi:phage shock protein PspC (stress-responsive transcriptional regulator)